MPAAATRRLPGLGLAVAVAGLAAGCSGTHEPAQREAPAHHTTHPTLDVPALLGEPIEQVRQHLQATTLPASAESEEAYVRLEPQATDSVQTFRGGGLLLLASYDVRTRRVHDLLLLGRREDTLMRRANLRDRSSDYLVLPVFYLNRPGVPLGVRVIDTSPDTVKAGANRL